MNKTGYKSHKLTEKSYNRVCILFRFQWFYKRYLDSLAEKGFTRTAVLESILWERIKAGKDDLPDDLKKQLSLMERENSLLMAEKEIDLSERERMVKVKGKTTPVYLKKTASLLASSMPVSEVIEYVKRTEPDFRPKKDYRLLLKLLKHEKVSAKLNMFAGMNRDTAVRRFNRLFYEFGKGAFLDLDYLARKELEKWKVLKKEQEGEREGTLGLE